MDEDTLTETSEDVCDSDGVEWDSEPEENTDAQQELGEWLGQLQALSQFGRRRMDESPLDQVDRLLQELETVRTGGKMVQNEAVLRQRPPKPAVPPKPPMDGVRFSRANLEDSPDVDLDALLSELCELEDQLNASTDAPPDLIFSGLPQRPAPAPVTECQRSNAILPLTDGASRLAVRGQQVDDCSASTSLAVRTASPDADSAFCDAVSVLSSESSTHRSRDSNVSSAESSHGSINTPSPTQQQETQQLRTVKEDKERENSEDSETRLKSEKIKLALEKMKEASIKKLYVKIFTSDGGSKSLLVDERSSVAYVLRQLGEKHRVMPNADFAIVEQYPDLFMERIYEDHEYLVENILMWTRDSPNKLMFLERPNKYAFLEEPQEYLVPQTSAERGAKLDYGRKQQMIEEFFAPNNVQPPELEGFLYLKAEGKKAWKKHYFVLRASGLYYIPKGKSKSSKDLVCLMNLEMIQIYSGIGWKRKYKAPTDWGFALKHPQIQVKASKYIKYLCTEDEQTYERWMAGLRIAKNGRQLYDNYEQLKNYLVSDEAKSGTASIHSSASDENCYEFANGTTYTDCSNRDSVVIRPRNSASITDQTEIKVRPRSADIQRGGQKRNSRSLVCVDLPTIPAEEELIQPQTYCVQVHRPPPENRHSSTSSGTESMLAFENDSPVTGTIKRQPQDTIRVVNAHQRRMSNEANASLHSNGKDSAEPDSDEEEFPPPPSPLPLQNGAHPRPVSQASTGSGKKRAPPPPRRSQNTRLTSGPAVPQKPRPPVAEKPRMAGEDFQSELQKAMARRLRKMEADGSEGDCSR